MKTPYVIAAALALSLHSIGAAQERTPPSDTISRDVIRELRSPAAAIAGYQTSRGYICGFLKGHDQLRVTLKARRNCYGDLLNTVVFHGDGRTGPYSPLAETSRELKRSQRAGHVLTVTYEPEYPGQPDGCWCDNRVIEWSSAPPPVRAQGPEAPAVSAEVAAVVGREARAATAQPEVGSPPPAEAQAGSALTELHPGPQTASGFVCRVARNREKHHVTMQLRAMENCLGQVEADVVFRGAGRAMEKLLRRLSEDGEVVTVTYMPVTNHVLSWESSPAAVVTPQVAAAAAAAQAVPEETGATEVLTGDAITKIRPRPIAEFKHQKGYVCQIERKSSPSALRVTFENLDSCGGLLMADVVFPAGGEQGPLFDLDVLEPEMRMLKAGGYLVSIKYVPEADGTNRAIEFSY